MAELENADPYREDGEQGLGNNEPPSPPSPNYSEMKVPSFQRHR